YRCMGRRNASPPATDWLALASALDETLSLRSSRSRVEGDKRTEGHRAPKRGPQRHESSPGAACRRRRIAVFRLVMYPDPNDRKRVSFQIGPSRLPSGHTMTLRKLSPAAVHQAAQSVVALHYGHRTWVTTIGDGDERGTPYAVGQGLPPEEC